MVQSNTEQASSGLRSPASEGSAITDDCLLLERPHTISGVQRLYRFRGGHGLSVVNCQMLHSYPFAWEIAVVKRR